MRSQAHQDTAAASEMDEARAPWSVPVLIRIVICEAENASSNSSDLDIGS